MNSYWAEQHARQHIHEMIGNARGDGLVLEAEGQRPDRLNVTSPGRLQRARTWIRALAARHPYRVVRVR
jgi:hypothetical protein